MEIKQRKSIMSELKPFCYLSGDDDYIEVTEWTNGEGIDVNISDSSGDKTIAMTFGEFKALKKAIKFLNEQNV
jgi:hypothetical protein